LIRRIRFAPSTTIKIGFPESCQTASEAAFPPLARAKRRKTRVTTPEWALRTSSSRLLAIAAYACSPFRAFAIACEGQEGDDAMT
jgi:hypothetical protein